MAEELVVVETGTTVVVELLVDDAGTVVVELLFEAGITIAVELLTGEDVDTGTVLVELLAETGITIAVELLAGEDVEVTMVLEVTTLLELAVDVTTVELGRMVVENGTGTMMVFEPVELVLFTVPGMGVRIASLHL